MIVSPSGPLLTDLISRIDPGTASAVHLTLLREYLSSAEARALAATYPEGLVPTWGVVPGERGRNTKRWERVQAGDVLFFAGKGKIRATGVITHKTRNASLAERLWSRDEDGETWEYIYFVDQIHSCAIPYTEFNAAAGYKSSNIVQGFEVLDPEKSARILSALDFGTGQEAIPGTEQDFLEAVELDPSQELDAVGKTKIRKEQGFLRRQLFGRRLHAECALCQRNFPVDLLVTAHVKKRSYCNADEKRDYRSNVVPMCKLGCDDLFEKGYVIIVDGVVTLNPAKTAKLTNPLKEMLAKLTGRTYLPFSERSARYYEWHSTHHAD